MESIDSSEGDLKLNRAGSKEGSKIGDVIEAVEKNEKMNEVGPEKMIEHAS